MGHFNSSSDQIVQELVNIFPNNLGIEGGNFSSPVYWNGSVYFAPVAGAVQAFKLTNGLLSTSPTSQTSETYAGGAARCRSPRTAPATGSSGRFRPAEPACPGSSTRTMQQT